MKPTAELSSNTSKKDSIKMDGVPVKAASLGRAAP
jgi:hypothetical protein